MRRCLGLLLLLPVFLLGCGGGEEDEDPQTLLDLAFSNPIRSADLELDAQLELKGGGLSDPVRIRASGPFRSNEGRLPSVDLSLRLGADGDGQVIETGFLSTGDRAFVKFQDVYYEQPRADVRRANRELRKRGRGSSLQALGLDPRSWLADARDEGSERVAGVETEHVSGVLDVTQLLRDLNDFVRRSRSAIDSGVETLTRTDILRIADVVKNPSFDVYVGSEDGILRRLSGRIEFEIPQAERENVDGVESGALEFSLEFRDVNGDQEIEAPARARPIAELTRSLGGEGALGDALGAATGGGEEDEETTTTPEDEEPVEPETPTAPATPTPQLPDGGADDGANPTAEDFRNYAECLDEARPEDTAALQECAELLQR